MVSTVVIQDYGMLRCPHTLELVVKGQALLALRWRRRSLTGDSGASTRADRLAVNVQVVPCVLARRRPWPRALVVGHGCGVV